MVFEALVYRSAFAGMCIVKGSAKVEGTVVMKMTIVAAVATMMMLSVAGAQEWTATIEHGVVSGKKPNKAYVWVPDGAGKIRGVFLTQACMFEAKIVNNDEIRRACAEKGVAVLYAEYGIGLGFLSGNGAKNFEEILRESAKAVNHPELEFAPLVTAGHSTAGIFCRNVAYWKPERMIGVVHIMSGNLQAHIEDGTKTLAGVPVLFINGEWEQYGPEGGDMKCGLRSNMGLRMRSDGKGEQQQSQTQWLCMRQQILSRRKKNPENMMGLVVSRNHSHTQWEDAMYGMVAQFIRSTADLRIPKETPDGKSVVMCVPLKAEQGWLLDADIKAPKLDPASYVEFKGDKSMALWYPDKAMAMKVWEYNQKGWTDPDPTADWPADKRYTPDACLDDLVDRPPAPVLTWIGGDGVWDAGSASWRNADGKTVPWSHDAHAVFEGGGGTVKTAAKVSCSGLTVGKGYTLDIGTNGISSRSTVAISPGSKLCVTVMPQESNGRWGYRVMAAGNTKVAGAIEIRGENIKAGTYNVVGGGSLKEGKFETVTVPDGWEGRVDGGRVSISQPAGDKPSAK